MNLTSLYRNFYETYSKKYGENTCILMLVGKFYELYDCINPDTDKPYTSIRRAVSIMNIVLKEKDATLWAGVPEQSLHKYATPLTREGWTVVVVDQVKDRADQVVDRIATRILSPGSHVENASQDRMTVVALWNANSIWASSIVDFTTGEVFSFQTKQTDDILHMLQVYCAKEVIISQEHDPAVIKSTFGIHGIVHKVPNAENFDMPFAREEYLRKMFQLKTMMPTRTALGLFDEPVERSLCLLLRFVEDHCPNEELIRHEIYTPQHHMRLSNNILEQLNIITDNQKSVLSMLERTHSAIGKRAMRERILRPITSDEELETRWDQVEWAQQTTLRIEKHLKALYDLPRLHYKLAEGYLEPTNILQMFQSYSATICLIQNLRNSKLACPEHLENQIVEFRRQVKTLLDEDKARDREDGQPIGFLTELSGPQTAKQEMKIQEIQETWQKSWAKFCSHAKIPVDSFKLEQKGDEFVWEGSRTYMKAIQGIIFTKSSNLTSLNVDYKKSGPLTLSCKELYTFIDELHISVKEMNRCLKQEVQAVCDTLWENVKEFQNSWVEWIGRVDCTMALAAVAKDFNWNKPALNSKGLIVKGLRHPLLESAQTRAEYISHDVTLGSENPNGWLIYGVNASGKSSLMKAVGIAVILAQAGSFVPATSFALRPYDAAFSRIWSHDNLWAGLSSFAVEIAELRDILSQSTDRSLVLGDEVCSGTESMSATALVASTLEHLDTRGSHFMFATHLHDLTKIPGFLPRPGIAVWHLRVQRTPEGKLIYDRTLQPGSGSCTYGLEVARAMGIPFTILDRAHEIRRALGGAASATDAPKSSWNANIQRQTCEICKADFVKDLEVHHIVQRADGGSNHIRNLAVLCERCHDKHHAGEIVVGELRMTSEGLERSTTSPPKKTKVLWTEEEMETISATIQKFKSHPPKRICLALEEAGITMTAAQVKKFI